MASPAPVYCVNHPNTETLLRCYRCGKPVCVKCVTRTPVGLICKQCLNNQQSGYYTATPVDYVVTVVVGIVLAFVGAFIARLLGGFWFFAIFYGPAAGTAMAEVIRFCVRKRRGRYIGLVTAIIIVVGGLVSIGFVPLIAALATGRIGALTGAFLNFGMIGFWIYLVLATSTVYARLR